MGRRSHTISFMVAALLHALLAALLFVSFEKTIFIPAEPSDPNKPIIQAAVVNQKSLQDEVLRLNAIEEKKRQEEKARAREILRKENEAKQQRLKEEALAQELKQKNEQLRKEAQEQKLAQAREAAAHQAKLKTEQEALKKLQIEKQLALVQKQKDEEQKKLDEKKAAELALQKAQEQKKLDEKKAAELAKLKALEKAQELEKEKALAQEKAAREAKEAARNAAIQKMNQDQVMRFAMMMRNKIHQHWRQPLGFNFSGFKCKIQVKLLPTGEVIEAVVVESSGNVEFDRSTELAIRKASPLPMPEDPALAKEFRQFTFTFHPEAA